MLYSNKYFDQNHLPEPEKKLSDLYKHDMQDFWYQIFVFHILHMQIITLKHKIYQ